MTTLSGLYETTGYIHKGAGVLNLEYVKGDSKKLFLAMYHNKRSLYLKRKHNKMKNAIKKDELVGSSYLQKPRKAAVAHW